MNFQVINNNFIELLRNIRQYFDNSNFYLHDARNKIKTIDYNSQTLVVKSFKIPHVINKIAYGFFRNSKAKKSYINSLRIKDFVPSPVGYIEFKKFGLLYDSYFISEQFEYDFTIRELLLNEKFEDKDLIFKEFANFTYLLHEQDIEHLDYSPGNILIKKQDGKYIIKTIDINRMKFRTMDTNARLKNFSKLWAKDADLEIIIEAYSKLINMNKNEAFKIAKEFSQQHKNKKNFKKRLKGKKVND
jgi:serine/threonine protein kinase